MKPVVLGLFLMVLSQAALAGPAIEHDLESAVASISKTFGANVLSNGTDGGGSCTIEVMQLEGFVPGVEVAIRNSRGLRRGFTVSAPDVRVVENRDDSSSTSSIVTYEI